MTPKQEKLPEPRKNRVEAALLAAQAASAGSEGRGTPAGRGTVPKVPLKV